MRRKKFMIPTMVILLGLAAIIAACQQEQQPEPTVTRPNLAQAPEADHASTRGGETTDTPEATGTTNPTLESESTATSEMASQESAVPSETSTKAATSQATPKAQVSVSPEGALLAVEMDSRAGVLLDEIPEEMRDEVVEDLLKRPESYWLELVQRQVRLTKRRLNFRNFAYEGKGQLPLPPEELWSIQLDNAGPILENIQGHDLLTVGYSFSSTLLTDAASPVQAEPALQVAGGKWSEPFILPADPDLLLQRTGNACLNEAGFPPNSFDSENAWIFFDFTCEADSGGVLGCHRSRLHQQSCLEALTGRVGTVETEVRFEHLDWDPVLADAVRVGELTHLDGPDLKVIGDDLDVNRVIYRYFPEDSCALVEQCVGDSGWRRLMQFNATVHNVGAQTLYIGPVVAENPVQNLFQYNACHAHYHFSDYGDFSFAGEDENLSSKQAFCVESTNRFSNNEWSPLVHEYSCRFQGVQAGWVDEYVAGLDCQWIDITDVDIPDEGDTFALGLNSNPDSFLCEGSLVLDEDGNPLWEPSGLETPDGRPINRPVCDFVDEWDVNNKEARDVFLMPAGSYVTEACSGGQLGPLRTCGFSLQSEGIEVPTGEGQEPPASDRRGSKDEVPDGGFACEPGEQVQLSCSLENGGDSQVMRLCEYSAALGSGVACTFDEALANHIVGEGTAEVSFTCPEERDATEPGGLYSLYTGSLLGDAESQPVSCQAE
jgi:hypothetical protein